MSSETIKSSYVTSVSYRFVLKWILKGKNLKKPPQNTTNASAIQSDLYLFKTAKDLRFYLEIDKSQYYYNMRIKGSQMWSFELAYAFLVNKETAFQLKDSSNQLSFLSSCKYINIPDEEDVQIHCLVIADPDPRASSGEDELSLKEGQNTVGIEGRPDIPLPEDYTSKMVIDFIRRGDIPNFNISMAIEIISEMEKHNCEVLKILCVQYLMRNITSESVRRISWAAINYDLPVLERACLEKIANGSIQTK